jgi:tetratricopeptide (TPR) repeat protein
VQIDPPATLTNARQLVASAQVYPALERYQALIDNASMLEETRADLRTLAEQNPEPKVIRLLGDAHMRLGDLEAALQTYLSALDQL